MILQSVFSACLIPLNIAMNSTALEGKSMRREINKNGITECQTVSLRLVQLL